MTMWFPEATGRRLPDSGDLRVFVSPIFSGSDSNILTVKLADGVTLSGSFAADETRPATATHTIVPYTSTPSSVMQVSNTARRAWTCYNNSNRNLFLKLGPSATTASFTVRLVPNAYYEVPYPVYTGVITGVWAAGGSGNAQVDELTP